MSKQNQTRVLFVCMGNICRSPLAEGVFLDELNRRGLTDQFEVDSAGTGGWHAGEPPDPRMIAVAAEQGITLVCRARQFRVEDFRNYDHIYCMDADNYEDLLALQSSAEHVQLFLEAAGHPELCEVPDPYYGGEDGFQSVFHLVREACVALLHQLTAERTTAHSG